MQLSNKVNEQVNLLVVLGRRIRMRISQMDALRTQNEEVRLDILSIDRGNRLSALLQYFHREEQILQNNEKLRYLYDSYAFVTNVALEYIIQMFENAEKGGAEASLNINRAKRAFDSLYATLHSHQELQIPFASVAPSITHLEIITDSMDYNIKRRVKLVKDCISPVF